MQFSILDPLYSLLKRLSNNTPVIMFFDKPSCTAFLKVLLRYIQDHVSHGFSSWLAEETVFTEGISGFSCKTSNHLQVHGQVFKEFQRYSRFICKVIRHKNKACIRGCKIAGDLRMGNPSSNNYMIANPQGRYEDHIFLL